MTEATVAEREAELLALQAAFDEYIASSRELEEELDAELESMQIKLSESTAANAALSGQLENISPQLASLETALSSSRQKLKEEQKQRRAAEQAQDEADNRVRELEQSLMTIREECDAVHEELAFKESELEETRLELEVEKQGLQNSLAQAKEALTVAESQTVREAPLESCAPPEKPDDDEYVKKLEEELELVTEQLIETEKRLSSVEEDIADKERQIQSLKSNEGIADTVAALEAEQAEWKATESQLRSEINVLTEELGLTREEVNLVQEELQAAELDATALKEKLDTEREEHSAELARANEEASEATINAKSGEEEVAVLSKSLQELSKENETLQDQVSGLENALENAKKDYQNVLDELNTVNDRFDEARAEAEQMGREAGAEAVRSVITSDTQHELQLVQESLNKLSVENQTLQKKVDDAEMALAEAKDRETDDDEQNEVVVQLRGQLSRAREEFDRKDKELSTFIKTLEGRLKGTEDRTSHLEGELHAAKGQLAEAEANIIVLKREKAEIESEKTELTKARGREETTEEEKPRERSSSPSSVMRLETKLLEETKKYQVLEKNFSELENQKRMGELRIKRLEDDLKTLQDQIYANEGAVVTQMSRISSMGKEDKSDLLFDEKENGNLASVIDSRDVEQMAEELTSLQKKFSSQREYNAQLLSKMLHLQGNIQVYCRIRPMSLTELQNGSKGVVEALSETEIGLFDSRTKKWKSFSFDRVWGPDQSQTSIFQDVEPLALSVVDGFNACIFAYGQTGSGKTYTMEGSLDGNQYGISYRTIQKIFYLLKLRAQQQRTAEVFVGTDDVQEEVKFAFSLKLGMLEIYNDEVYDLLASSGSSMEEKKETAMKAGGKASLEIRRNQDGRVEVPNLVREDVNTIEEVMELLKRGNSNRATAATDLNEHSSRSHMVLSVDVCSGLEDTDRNKGTLYLVDLAGSERVRKSNVAGDNLKEAGFINKSLSALGNVMEALDRKASHVPYRDSKLTYLLQNALGGNSRTMMVVTACPIDEAHDESIHALQFATRVRRIQIGSAQRNITSKNLEETVKKLTEELRAITRAKERTEGQLHTLKRDNTRVQEKLNNLSKTRTQNKSDSKTLEVLRKNNDEMAARWQHEKAAKEEANEEVDKLRKEGRLTQQQLGRYKSKLNQLEQKLEDKEKALEKAAENLRAERNKKSADAVRSRRTEVLATRTKPTTPTPSPSKLKPSNGSKAPKPVANEKDSDTSEIRAKVLALLEKHDKAKIDRIDIIMDKFKGKEALLLEKMTQRYESGSVSSASTFQSRNAMALQRHQERMRKIQEKRLQANGP